MTSFVVKPALLFCSTSWPLASTRWACTTFSSNYPLSSMQRHWLTSAMSTIFSSETFLETLVIKPGAAGSGSKYASHCAMLPPPTLSAFVHLQQKVLLQFQNWKCSKFEQKKPSSVLNMKFKRNYFPIEIKGRYTFIFGVVTFSPDDFSPRWTNRLKRFSSWRIITSSRRWWGSESFYSLDCTVRGWNFEYS